MTMNELREVVSDVVSDFFRDAAVIWAEQSATKPQPPYVTIKFGNVTRNLFPVGDSFERKYEQMVTMELNLYTKGKLVSGNRKGEIKNYANTATADMIDFVNYLDSEEITDRLGGISILLNSQVRDLTSLENDSKYRYRAMAEFNVYFQQEANGRYGISGKNYSGGGSEEMTDVAIETIDDVEITGGVNEE